MDDEPILPSFEQYAPADLLAEEECVEVAFTVLSQFGKPRSFGQGDTLVELNVSGRVDSLRSDSDDKQTSIRLRSVPEDSENRIDDQYISDDSDDEPVEVRDCIAAIVEYGVSRDGDFYLDEHFDWEPRVAIIADVTYAAGIVDIFICDAKTGKELDASEVSNLLFILLHVQKNLQAERIQDFTVSFMDEENETLDISTKYDAPEPCEQCNTPYGMCLHNSEHLN